MSVTRTGATERNARQAARAMSNLTLAAGALLGLGLAYAVGRAALDRQWVDTLMVARFPGLDPVLVGTMAVLVTIVWMAAQAAVLAIALHAIWRTFDVLSRSNILAPEAGLLLRRAGIAFAVSAALMFLATPVLSLAVSANAPAGQRFISIGMGSSELLTLLVAGVLVALGHVLSLAAEIDEDNRQIV